jgi:hypothetical protein
VAYKELSTSGFTGIQCAILKSIFNFETMQMFKSRPDFGGNSGGGGKFKGGAAVTTPMES